MNSGYGKDKLGEFIAIMYDDGIYPESSYTSNMPGAERRPKLLDTTPAKVKEYLDQYVSGQDKVKEKLATLAFLYSKKREMLHHPNLESCADQFPRLNMFITGPTGTGKTYLCETLAAYMELPCMRIDCSSLSQEGWAGESLSDALWPHNSEVEAAKGGIIILDEFDKLSLMVSSSNGGCPSLGIQYNLLDLLDGKYAGAAETKRRLTEHFNNCLIILSGAFETARDNNKDVRGIGFDAKTTEKMKDWKDIMVKAGIAPEIAGRIINIEETEPLSKSQIMDILTLKKNSIIKKYTSAQIKGVSFSSQDIEDLAERIHGSRYGMRELERMAFDIVHEKLLNMSSK